MTDTIIFIMQVAEPLITFFFSHFIWLSSRYDGYLLDELRVTVEVLDQFMMNRQLVSLS
jgi:hypothetical protein